MQDPRLIDIKGHTLAAFGYNEEIDSIPIIFIHGFTASIAFWKRCQVPLVDEQFQWYSLSLPGHYPAMLPEGFEDPDLTDRKSVV